MLNFLFNYLFRRLFAFLLIALTITNLRAELSDAAKVEFFDKKINPILQKECYKCHGGRDKLKGELRLTSRAGILQGGESGAALNFNKPEESLLLTMLSWKDENHEMPPNEKLPDDQIALLTQWVKLGAPYNPTKEIHGKEVSNGELPTNKINKRTKSAWAFNSGNLPAIPKTDNDQWQKSGIDAFVFSNLKKKGLLPNGPASKQVLIRRAYYGLTGLPPSIEDVNAFVEDNSLS